MPEYRLSLDFTAADDAQAERLALAWADTCAAEYGTRMAGFERIDPDTGDPCRHWLGPQGRAHFDRYYGDPPDTASGSYEPPTEGQR